MPDQPTVASGPEPDWAPLLRAGSAIAAEARAAVKVHNSAGWFFMLSFHAAAEQNFWKFPISVTIPRSALEQSTSGCNKGHAVNYDSAHHCCSLLSRCLGI